jgi:hypothetical protein
VFDVCSFTPTVCNCNNLCIVTLFVLQRHVEHTAYNRNFVVTPCPCTWPSAPSSPPSTGRCGGCTSAGTPPLAPQPLFCCKCTHSPSTTTRHYGASDCAVTDTPSLTKTRPFSSWCTGSSRWGSRDMCPPRAFACTGC